MCQASISQNANLFNQFSVINDKILDNFIFPNYVVVVAIQFERYFSITFVFDYTQGGLEVRITR